MFYRLFYLHTYNRRYKPQTRKGLEEQRWNCQKQTTMIMWGYITLEGVSTCMLKYIPTHPLRFII